jgi:hypothetical protein
MSFIDEIFDNIEMTSPAEVRGGGAVYDSSSVNSV